ncbi:MAG: phospholipase D-like domain-containing protein [Pseudomonadota bacterium]
MDRERATDHTLYFEGDALYADMLHAIDTARERVWMESYIFSADAVGRRFGAALARAARRGLDVRLHVDALGSLFQLPTTFVTTLRRAGVRFRAFHRWSWRDPWRYNRRNHCKMLIVDHHRFFVGGFNIHRQSSARHYGRQRWRDTHIALEDPSLTAHATGLFETFWQRRPPAWLRHRPPDPAVDGDLLISNRLPSQRHALSRLFHHGLGSARVEILLTTPYFAPDRRTRRLLYAAAARGVTVHLLLPGVTDRWLLRMTAWHIYQRLLHRGVHIHEYRPRTLHAKTLVVDGNWATLGTANLDYRSLLHNYEINYVTRRAGICSELSRQFGRDREEAETITRAHLPRRRWWERLAGVIGWRFRHWL